MIDAIKAFQMPKQPTDDTTDFIAAVKKLSKKSGFANQDLDHLAGSLINVNKEAVKVAKSIQQTGGSVDDLDRFLISGSSDAEKLGKAIKSAAINMGAMIAVTLAIQAAIYIIDELYVSFDEQQEIVDNLTTKIESLKQEYDALQQDPSISGKKLESLKREIEYQEDLLAIEKERLAVKYMDEEMPETKDEQTGTSGGHVNPTYTPQDTYLTDIQGGLNKLQQAREQMEKIDSSGGFGKNLGGWETQETNAIQQVSDALGEAKERYLEIGTAKETLEGYIDDGILKGFKAEQAKEKIAKFQAEMDELEPIILNAELAIGEAHFTEYYDRDLDELKNSTIVADGDIGGNLSSDNIAYIANDLKELNESLRDGKIATDGWFTAIKRLVSDNSLDEAIRSVEDWSTSATDGLEAMITTMVTQLTNGMTEASNAFLRGETSVSDYIDELEAGSKAQLQMLETTHDLTVDEKGFAKAVSKDGKKVSKATEKAADAYNELKDSVDELSDVKGLADALSSEQGFLENYQSWTEDMFNNQDFQNYIDGLSSSIIDWIDGNEQKAQQFAQSLQGTVSETVDATKFLSDDANAYLQSITGDNMSATISMADFAINTVSGTISNSTEAVGTVIGALGDLISEFDYKIEAKPYIAGNITDNIIDLKKDGSFKLSPLPAFGFDISGSAQGNTATALNSLKEAANYFKTTGAKAATDAAKNPKNYTKPPTSSGIKNNDLPDDDDNGSGGSGSGSKGSGSSKDPHVAEVDKYKNLTDAVDEYDRKLEQLDRVYENTDNIDERIALKQQEIKLYQEQKDAIDALNKARDEEITGLVAKLRGQGFQIEYDPSTEYLLIKNREHINDLNQSIIEEYEDYIDKVDELNDANKDSADQWDELTYSIVEAGKAIEDLEQEKYEDYIETAEHILHLIKNRKDAFGKESSVYLKMMNTTLQRWADLVKTDYTGNLDQIRELEEAWMDFYDERIEKEKEILELQLNDNDAVLDGVIKVIEDQIDALDDQIDGLQKANDERKKALELQKAQAELDKQRNQKTRQVLRKGVGWVWEADEDAIKEAEENLADLEYDAKIDALEDEKEALEDLKEKWEEIPDIVEDEQNRLLMIEKLGANAEEDILNDRIDTYENFKDEYVDIQQQIQDKTDELEEHTSTAYLTVVKAFENMANLAGITLDTNTGTGSTTQSSWYVNRDGTAPSDAKVGDIVYTKGGTYQITAKDENGKFTSKKINNQSTDISDNLWGTLANVMSESNEEFSESIDKIVAQNKELAEQTKQQILETNGWSKIIADNTGMTQEEITALFENVDMNDILSEYTDENSDATDKNTRAILSLITALANMEEEDEEEDERMTLDNFDDSIMDASDQAYVKQLQQAWNTAMEQGNYELADQIHAMADAARARYLDDDDTNDYNAIAKDIEKLKDSKYEVVSVKQIGGTNGDKEATDKYLSNLKWLKEKSEGVASKEFMDRLDAVENEVKNGAGLTEVVSKDQFGRTSTVIDYADPTKNTTGTAGGSTNSSSKSEGAKKTDTLSKSDSDAIKAAQKAYNEAKAKGDTTGMNKAHADAEAIRNKNGYSGGTDGSKVIENSNTKLSKSVDASTKASTYAGDSHREAADSISDTADKVSSTMKDAADTMASAASRSSSSGGSSGGSKKSSGSSNSTYKTGQTTSPDGKTTVTHNGNVTITSTTNKDGSTTHKVTNNATGGTIGTVNKKPGEKAKGGLNLDAGTYNVDEIGAELIVNPVEDPVKGRLVTLNYGSNVIPADVSKRLWEMGKNPKAFISDVIGGQLTNTNQIVYTAGVGQPNVTNYYTIEDVSLPNVAKPEDFWQQLTQNLPNEASQWSRSKTTRY